MKKKVKDAYPKHPFSWKRIGNQAKAVLGNPFNLVTMLCIILLFCLVVIPLLSMIRDTFVIETADARRAREEAGSVSLFYWKYILTSKMAKSTFYKPLLNSLLVSVCSTVIAVPLGALLAWLMVRSNLPGKKFISLLILIPYMVPSWCKSQAWLSLFRSNLSGVPGLLYWLGWKVPDTIAYGPFAIICVLSLHYYAFAYILISGALGTINSELEEMALIQGASKTQIIRKITLPLVLPAFLSAAIMTMTKALGGYSVPSYLGLKVEYYTLSVKLHDAVGGGMARAGYAIAILLIAVSSLMILINSRLIGTRKSYSTINGKGGHSAEIPLGKSRGIIFALVVLFLIVAMFIPLASLLLESFQVTPINGLSKGNLTLFNWIGKAEDSYILVDYEPGLLRNPRFAQSCWNTVKLGCLGALVSTIFGQIIGYISVRGRGKWYSQLVEQMAFIPYLIPAIAFSAIYIAMFLKPKLGGLIPSLYGTFFLILLICAVKYFPYASRAGTSTMIQISADLEEAAEINGAGFFRRFVKIVLPLAKNGIVSGFILTFINIAKEFDLISLVINNKNSTLSYLSYQYMSREMYPMAAATSIVIILVVTTCYLIAKKLFKADLVSSMG